MKNRKTLLSHICIWTGLVLLLAAELLYHFRTPFMMDDLWYSTNLATNGPLTGLADVIEGQVWHYLNWGGRSITHGLLQLVLMSGDTIANLLNLGMTLLLAWMICIFTGHRNLRCFFSANVLLLALNANIQYSMVWQAGAVNYVYSTVWILIFLYAYIRVLDTPQKPDLPLVWLWILPLGLITGWSNENMGPACFLGTLMILFYLWKIRKTKPPVWMLLGSLSSLAGSILVIVAPGNFVRSATIPDTSLGEALYARIFSMLQAGMNFLFPSLLFLFACMTVTYAVLKLKPTAEEVILFLIALLSYGAMVLSPHYPDRATFGTMVICIILIIKLIIRMQNHIPGLVRYYNAALGMLWLYSLLTLYLQMTT